ncbi:MAG: hypothetical protein F6K16_12775 [Symploca sp. SIO2B6]|nr:hypothetical protein [Symploca sp. SIO2B6]
MIRSALMQAELTCGSHSIINNGLTHGAKQNNKGKNCDRQLIEDFSWQMISPNNQAMLDRLFLERVNWG